MAVGEDTRGASARATLSASPRALATSSRSASAGVLESHSGFGFGFGFGFFGETASRAFPSELEPSAFLFSRADFFSGDAEERIAVGPSARRASEGSSAVRPFFVSIPIPSPSHETSLSDGSNGGGGGASSSLDSGRVHEVRPVADSCQYRRPVALHRAARHDCVFFCADGVRPDASARTDETYARFVTAATLSCRSEGISL